ISTNARAPRLAWALIAILGVMLLVGIGVLVAIVGYYQVNRVILPGVSFRGMDLGGLSQVAAAEKINRVWNEQSSFQMSDGVTTWGVTADFFGLRLDANAIAQNAYEANRSGNYLDEITRRMSVINLEVPPVIVYDSQVARENLLRWSQMVDRPATDARLEYQNGKVSIISAEAGTRLDVDRTLKTITADPAGTFLIKQVRVFFLPVEPLVKDLSAVARQIHDLEQLHLAGVIFDPIRNQRIPWQVPPETIQGWIRVEHLEDGSYQVSLDQSQLVAYLADLDSHVDLGEGRVLTPVEDPSELAQQVLAGKPPILLVRHLPGEYVTDRGESMLSVAWKVGIPMWRILQANPTLNQNYIPAGTRMILPSQDDLLPLPVVINKRIVISTTDQRMRVFQDGERIREFVISTGIGDSPTQPGIFQVQTHEINAYADNWDLWMPHWMGIYEAWPGFMNGIHGLPMLSNGVRLWKNVLGRPASYGCIILDLPEAEWLYGWAENGVVVEIQP
ncbi:MAG: L,D-transpeptidase/peptidoglycan binding protein, partial [Anaerolineaceae bacterium]|nr:L,D-transpeptidase/peptidoglycan binding protein [Anaerolineaceae bacterium]